VHTIALMGLRLVRSQWSESVRPTSRGGGKGCRMDAHKHVVIIGYRLVDLLEFEDVRRTVADLDDCLHGVPRIPLIPAKPSVVRVSGAQPRRDDCSFRVCSMRLFVWNPLRALRQGDYHVVALVPVVDVPVRVDDFVRSIGAVNHGPDLTLRGQLADRTGTSVSNAPARAWDL
jgi:hypothetical protein